MDTIKFFKIPKTNGIYVDKATGDILAMDIEGNLSKIDINMEIDDCDE